jgi:hypothetical protein
VCARLPLSSEGAVWPRRLRIPLGGTLLVGSRHRVDVNGRLIGKHELAIDDLNPRAERRAAWRVADREKQLTPGFEDILERITRIGQARCRSQTKAATGRPGSCAGPTHGEQI